MAKLKIARVLTCSEEEDIVKIARTMSQKKDRRMFVLDKSKKLIGIITVTDLAFKALAKNKINLKAKDIMTKGVKSVDITEPLEKAFEIMNPLKTYTCPITKNGKLLGVVHHHDLMSCLFSNK